MKTSRIEVINRLGLHARAANKLVEVTNRFSSDIQIKHDHQKETVNAKSIMAVMLLAAPKGSWLDVIAQGDDEEQAIQAIEQIFSDYFGEGG